MPTQEAEDTGCNGLSERPGAAPSRSPYDTIGRTGPTEHSRVRNGSRFTPSGVCGFQAVGLNGTRSWQGSPNTIFLGFLRPLHAVVGKPDSPGPLTLFFHEGLECESV